jgi:hypothetical protein
LITQKYTPTFEWLEVTAALWDNRLTGAKMNGEKSLAEPDDFSG